VLQRRIILDEWTTLVLRRPYPPRSGTMDGEARQGEALFRRR
jgi:hypothetical protein